ncbi:type IV conjugative transfer system pilin TraA [Pantoea cypripedii]|uniref:Pilin n=1 Tax=Pantoea cypripedii TaxID=55209 RepID=A0A1X1EMD0_PANCY|nr:type IV conjugative transfer system pilin TraA [Pantoea cypripedii]MBP2200565.1 type IV conjugative transfer system pilin TraA [Pantoea cypripedii]ORM90061.1 conjugal transfer protein TraA [Pantoea cypripedii]
MKVVTGKPALAEGAAEACPAFRTALPSGFIGTLYRSFSLLWRHRANVLLIALAVLFFALPHLVRAEDLLSSQKQDAKDTFGHGSTIEWGLYIAEVLISIGAYIKTRNPMLFVGGLGFLIVVTRVLFSLAG